MEVFYYRGAKPNFGDDLNADLWPQVFSAEMMAAPDILLVGIGSILTEEWLGHLHGTERRVLVLGTGTSYDVPPRAVRDWSVLAVRGPWTAQLIGKPESAATDGAILVADTPDLTGPSRERTDVVFMPHHRTLRRTRWREIAAEAGMRCVSPQQPVEQVMAAFGTARLVVTEAMHGAIVADSLRIPWVPVIVSPTVDEFKWRDWCLSMKVDYTPFEIPAVDARDRGRYRRMERVLRIQHANGHQNLACVETEAGLRDYFERRFSPHTKASLLAADHGSTVTRARALLGRPVDANHRRQAVQALRAAATRRPCLSTDPQFRSRLDQMRDAVGRAEELALHG